MKEKTSKLALKLARRIEEELGIEVKPLIHRESPGYIQRRDGAWSWCMFRKDGAGSIGSENTAKMVVKAKKWETIKTGYLCEIIVED